MHVQRFSDNGGTGRGPLYRSDPNSDPNSGPKSLNNQSSLRKSCFSSKTPGVVGGNHEDPLVGLHTLHSRFTQQQLSSTVTLTQSGYKTPASDVTHY